MLENFLCYKIVPDFYRHQHVPCCTQYFMPSLQHICQCVSSPSATGFSLYYKDEDGSLQPTCRQHAMLSLFRSKMEDGKHPHPPRKQTKACPSQTFQRIFSFIYFLTISPKFFCKYGYIFLNSNSFISLSCRLQAILNMPSSF